MKKTVILLALSLVFSGAFCAFALANETAPEVYVDYEKLEFTAEPEFREGVVFAPVRPVIKAFNNRDVFFADTKDGKMLTLNTSDGRFTLNIDNGAYAYIIENDSYGVISLYDDTGEDKMGILAHKPYIKEGCTMIPVGEVIEILDGEAYYDEGLNRLSVISTVYKKYAEYAGEPFPVVAAVCSDIGDVYEAAKIADTEGYEEFAEKCIEFLGYDEAEFWDYDDEEDEEEPEEFFDYFYEEDYSEEYYEEDGIKAVFTELFGYLYELKESPLIEGILKDFLYESYADQVVVNDELSMEESVDNGIDYLAERLNNKEYEGSFEVNGEYKELGGLAVLVMDFYNEASELSYNDLSEEVMEGINKKSEQIAVIFMYLYYKYDDDVWDYLEEKSYDLMDAADYSYGGSFNDIYNFNLKFSK